MQKILLHIIKVFFFLLFFISCSYHSRTPTISIMAPNAGLLQETKAEFPIFLTESFIKRNELEKKYSKDIFIIHTGHFLKPQLTKEENTKNLENLKMAGIDLINLTLEDFVVADSQEINLENYDQAFVNSSVIDLISDSLASLKNVKSFHLHKKVVFIGLSDNKIDPKLQNKNSLNKFIVDDHVLSILKIKKIFTDLDYGKDERSFNSFILIHNLGDDINKVMERLPPPVTI